MKQTVAKEFAMFERVKEKVFVVFHIPLETTHEYAEWYLYITLTNPLSVIALDIWLIGNNYITVF